MIDEKTIRYGDVFRFIGSASPKMYFMFVRWDFDETHEGPIWVGVDMDLYEVNRVARRRGFRTGVWVQEAR